MSQTLTKLRVYRNQATQTERAIIDYILQNSLILSQMSIHELASRTYASPTSIIRLCKKLGYDGYKSFHHSLVIDQTIRQMTFEKEANQHLVKSNSEQISYAVMQNNLSILTSLQQLMNQATINQAVDKIMKADKVIFFGLGASLIVAKDAQMKFVRVNKMVHVAEDWHTQLLMARNMSQQDVAFAISYSGETDEIITCAEEAKKLGATIISLTKVGDSSLAQLSHIPLFVPDTEIGMRSAAMSSRIAQMTVIDIIFSNYVHCNYEESVLMIERTRIKKGGENE